MTNPNFDEIRGAPPVLQFISPSQLLIDRTYQREIDSGSAKLIRRIAKAWDWALCNALLVARRREGENERLFVVDGQHRLSAARLRGDIAHLPCVVIETSGAESEANRFVSVNSDRRPLTAYALWRAALAAGEETAVSLHRIMTANGYDFTGGADWQRNPPMRLSNVKAVRDFHAMAGDKITRAVFEIMAATFGDQRIRYGALLFRGIARLILDSDLSDFALDRDRLVKVLRSQDECDWFRAFSIRALENAGRAQDHAAAVIAAAYRDVG